MITTITPSHTIPIPEDISRQFGIQPGWWLDWSPIEGRDESASRHSRTRGIGSAIARGWASVLARTGQHR